MSKITIELTQEQLDAIKASGLLEQKSEWYEPKEGERFFFLSICGVTSLEFTNCPSDKSILKRQRVYRTREEAEKADECRIALTAVQHYIAKNMPFTPDWSDDYQKKWCLHYNHQTSEFSLEFFRYSQGIPSFGLYVGSLEDAKRLGNDMEPQLRILWGV